MSDIGNSPTRRSIWHWPEQTAAYCAALTIAVIISPFSTFEMPLPTRTLYWAMALAAGWLSVSGLILIFHRLPASHPMMAWRPMQRAGLAVILAALPTTLAVFTIEKMLRPDSASTAPWGLLLNVTVICILIGGAMLVRLRTRLDPPAPVPARNPFLDRLPPNMGTGLISLSMQDHYVAVTTTKGECLILLRMSDALSELADYPGRQIHRSHWISAHAFTGLTRDNGKLMAHLVDGRALPVSRSHANEVKRMAPLRPDPHHD